ncbi:hypothetical protein TNCV_230061 [Trichonephila clavipes]|nr:hypothetical protein TNCV_230061 [Trichonephila clavipes]
MAVVAYWGYGHEFVMAIVEFRIRVQMPLKTRHVDGLIHVKSIAAQNPHIGIVRENRVRLRMSTNLVDPILQRRIKLVGGSWRIILFNIRQRWVDKLNSSLCQLIGDQEIAQWRAKAFVPISVFLTLGTEVKIVHLEMNSISHPSNRRQQWGNPPSEAAPGFDSGERCYQWEHQPNVVDHNFREH